MEYWTPISEKYSVSTFGRVWSANIGIMKTPINNTGYPHLSLSLDGRFIRYLVHRIMAKAFLQNPDNKREVNHKNGKRWDNRIENLEWVTSSENKIHKYDVLGGRGADNFHRRKTILAYRETQPIVIEFNGIRETARELGFNYQTVQGVIRGQKKAYKGWRFEIAFDPNWVSKTGKKY